jgi:hypothetical protein
VDEDVHRGAVAGLSRHVDVKLVSRLEFSSAAVAMRYEPRRWPPGAPKLRVGLARGSRVRRRNRVPIARVAEGRPINPVIRRTGYDPDS